MCRITVITSLFNCLQYLEGYFEAVGRIQNKNEIEILLIHNAPQQSELAVINKYLPGFPFIRHIQLEEREGLYATWNRGVTLSKANYLTIWNVDDVRLPSSLKDQADSLDKYPNAAISYGDFVIVDQYGKTEGKIISEPEFESNSGKFLCKHHIGCFPMWRKEVHGTIGYFDEQFRLIADLDFQIRVAKKYPLVKTNKQLGFYLEGTPSNLSSNSRLQDMEHTVLHLRYGNFNRIYLTYLFSGLSKFQLFKIKWFGKYHSMNRWTLKDFSLYMSRFPLICVSIFKFPRHLARKYLKKYYYEILLGRKNRVTTTSG